MFTSLHFRATPFLRVALVLMSLTLMACAKPMPPVVHDGDALWKNYVQSGTGSLTPFRTQLTLRYGSEGETQRVSALLWGNNAEELRLDINASVGLTVAKVYENTDTFLVYAPRENEAYSHRGPQKPLFNVGVPMPLGLTSLTELIMGQYAKVFGDTFGEAMPIDSGDENNEGAVRYRINLGSFSGNLVLNAQALPLWWQEEGSNGWKISFSYRELETKPYKLDIEHAGTGRRALLLIKERTVNLPLFTPAQMRLILPKETTVLPLEELQ